MNRKFSELTPSEQIQFQGLVDFMKETWNEDFQVKLNIIKKFRLDPKDPIVYDFLTDIYTPTLSQPQTVSVGKISNQGVELAEPTKPPLLATTTTSKPLEKTKKREVTYANSEDLIVIQNRLLHAISHLTLNERRLILFLSPIVRKETYKNPNQVNFFVNIQEFAKTYNIKGNSVYEQVRKYADSIQDKSIYFWSYEKNSKDELEFVESKLSWVVKTTFFDDNTEIQLKLDKDMIEMLTVFDKATGNFWTQYQKEWIAHLGSYGIIMLEMVLSSRENNGYYTVEHLREKFNCVDTYPIFGDFKRYVIDKSIKDIEKYTPIKINYEINKVGKNVKGLTFSYTDTSIKTVKDKTKNNDKPQEKNPFVNFKMSQKQLSLFAGKIKKASGQDVEEIIAELSNVHLQSKHIDFLKVLDYVPSDWYSNEEIKSHPTAEQIVQAQAEAEQERLKQKQAKKQAIDEQKHQEQQAVEQRHKQLAELFESLPPDEQERALNEVEKFFKGNLMFDWFDEARKQGTAHKDVRFMAKFYEYFGI